MRTEEDFKAMGLSDAEIKALSTPMGDLTPETLQIAMAAKDRVVEYIREENEKYVPPKREFKPQIVRDYEPYESPVTGEVIGGRAQLREHLKRHNCRLVEPSERKSIGI